jgi:fatty-acyl-CoA synthase
VLLDNVPETLFWLEGCALAGAALVGLNTTRRGDALLTDLTHTDCQVLVTDRAHLALVPSELPSGIRLLVVDDPSYSQELDPYRGAPPPEPAIKESDIFVLIFTSGTTTSPKAVIRTQGTFATFSERVAERLGVREDDVAYNSMPWFHSNALYVTYGPVLATGATLALRERFSASAFASDVRKFRATYFNYVGKPLEYILATPPRPDDTDNCLRFGLGNEANETDVVAFSARFGVPVTDGYGSSENALTISRTPDTPAGALGKPAIAGVIVADPETGKECPPAVFDESGHLVNADAAIGELVNTTRLHDFAGYYKNDEANASRMRHGWYWSGDLGYRDADGFFYFAGRGYDWLRVDGENFAAAPIERILLRHPDVLLAAVYAVPDAHVGDQVMAALQLLDGSAFDPVAFAHFLEGQADLGTKWAPRYMRVCSSLPLTSTNKILKRELRAERWDTTDPVWQRLGRSLEYRPFTAADRAELLAAFEEAGRTSVLETGAG